MKDFQGLTEGVVQGKLSRPKKRADSKSESPGKEISEKYGGTAASFPRIMGKFSLQEDLCPYRRGICMILGLFIQVADS
jgi:hypothetical protein